MISVHRTNSTGTHLVGSDIEHQQFITLKISTANYERTLKNDWFFPDRNLIEISMSLSQWAEFISSPNTSGVPCTLERIQGKCLFEDEEVPFIDKIKLHDDEYKRHWANNVKELKTIYERTDNGYIDTQYFVQDGEIFYKIGTDSRGGACVIVDRSYFPIWKLILILVLILLFIGLIILIILIIKRKRKKDDDEIERNISENYKN